MKINLLVLLILTWNVSITQNIWEPISFPDTIHPQTINAQNKDFLFVTARGPGGIIYLLRSNNDGFTWETLNLKTNYFNECFTINYNSEGVLFLGYRENIFRSFDNGNNFDTVYANYDTQDVVTKIRSFNNGDTYALGRSKIIRTSDNGDTWDTIYNSTLNPWQYFEDITITEDGSIFTVCLDYDSVVSGFFRSLDNAQTWEHLGVTATDLQSIKVNSNGQLIVCGVDLNGIFSSSDIGETWSSTSNLRASTMESYINDQLIAGSNIENETGCWLSLDWGMNWVDLVDSIINPQVHQISISPTNHIYIQSDFYPDSNQLFKSINPLMNITEQIKLINIELYPNPTSNVIHVKNHTSFDIEQYKIYNQNGQIVLKGKMIGEKIIVSNLQSGIYIIDFKLENQNMRKTFIKQE